MPAEVGRAGIYIHLPFCSAVCPYCDFSVLRDHPRWRPRYLDSLRREIELQEDWDLPCDTVYLGGGTPTLLSPAELAEILEAVRRGFDLEPQAGLYLEANPEDVTAENLACWKELGVTFLSLGVQSLKDEDLAFLGRRHSALDSLRSLELALDGGFDTVSADLIFGLPHQTSDSWKRELKRLVELRPQHVSCYQLTVHRGTPFGFRRERGLLRELAGEAQADLFFITREELVAAGYEGYEVSNFARRKEHRSQHNLKYWRHAPYLGLGQGAHSFRERRRWWNERKIKAYTERIARGDLPIEGEESLQAVDLAFEAVILGLRQREGVDLSAIRRNWAVDLLPANEELLETLDGEGLVWKRGECLLPSERGMALADNLARRFVIPVPDDA